MHSSANVGRDFYADQNDADIGYDEERTQLLMGTRALNRASASLHRAKQISAQTDEVADGVMENLQDQGVQLRNTRNRLSNIDEETVRSRRLISTIAWQALQNRIMLIIIIILEVLILLGVLGYKLYHKFH